MSGCVTLLNGFAVCSVILLLFFCFLVGFVWFTYVLFLRKVKGNKYHIYLLRSFWVCSCARVPVSVCGFVNLRSLWARSYLPSVLVAEKIVGNSRKTR
jgi:hypothetical protein